MKTEVITTVGEIRDRLKIARDEGKSIGLVPTMGALHSGHTSLIHAARSATNFVVVSIFVNPAQFGPTEDFERYPRTLEADRQLCDAVGTDLIFAPPVSEVYAPNHRTWVDIETLGEQLCGASRPGHFRGVCTIVLKLFNITMADHAFFGQKDAQQARILEKMATDLNLFTQVHVCPTVREADGLAMSSRNRYLSPAERYQAPVLYRTLQWIKEEVRRGERECHTLIDEIKRRLFAIPGTRIDYVQIVDSNLLKPLIQIDRPALAAVAVFFGSTRLIDNVQLDPVSPGE
jgi:pantoate--beta-alanine ligase